jgi:hypothetical protein
MIEPGCTERSGERATAMPIHYERNDKTRRILAISEGDVTVEDTLAIIDRQVADGAWTYHMLFDTRASAALPTIDDLRRLLKHVGALTTKYGPRGPVAMVVVNPALYQIGGKYARLANLTASRVGLFMTPREAEEWLATVDD